MKLTTQKIALGRWVNKGSLLMLTLATAAPAHALVTNGSFQSGPEFYADGWTHSNVAYARSDVTFTSVGYAGASPYGGRFVAFNEGNYAAINAISQTLTTVIGQEYTLRFAYGAAGNNAAQRLNVTVGTLDTFYTDTTSSYDLSTLWQEVSVNFFATSTSTVLLFTDYGSDGHQCDLFLDNVSVEAVPEPALIGLLGLAMVSRRRHKG